MNTSPSKASQSFQLSVLGHALTDITASCEDDFLKKQAIPKGMMRLVKTEDIQALHELLPEDLTVTPGGSACNTAVAAAELGMEVAFMGTVSDDEIGARFTRALDNAGVKFPVDPIENAGMSGVSVILVTPDGERSMNTCLGVSGALDAMHLDKDLIAQSQWLFIEGYLLDNPQCDDLLAAAFEAKPQKIAMSLSDPLCVARNHARFMTLVKDHVGLVFGNEAEFKALFGKVSISYIAKKLGDWPGIMVMTRSAKPAWVLRRKSIMKIPAIKVARVADATGAGDHFAAGFLKALVDGRPLPECAECGHACAAGIIGRRGGR